MGYCFEYDADNLDLIIKQASEDLFDDFVYDNKLKMETDADKALAISLFTNKITYLLMDHTGYIHPEEVEA